MAFAFGNFVLDDSRFELRRGTARIAVQPKVLRLLLYLAEHRERAISSQELLQQLWPGEHVTSASVKRAICGARQALGEAGDSQSSIRTIRGCGYKWALPLRVVAAAQHERVQQTTASDLSVLASGGCPHETFGGRADVLEAFERHLDAALRGHGRVVLFTGEPGIGKTRMLSEVARRAVLAGASAWFGRCLHEDGVPPFWPWAQVLREAERERGARELSGLMACRAADIAAGIPDLRQWLPGLPAPRPIARASARFRFFDSMAIFLERAAQQRPIVLLFDDLQLADQPTLQLLSFLGRQLDAAPVLVVASVRPIGFQTEAVREELVEFIRKVTPISVPLEGLDLVEVGHYVRQRTGRTVPADVIRKLHALTGGNPLLLQRVLDVPHAGDPGEGFTAAEEPRFGSRALGLSAAIAQFLEVVDEPCRRVLRAAALLGCEFSLDRLSALLSAEPHTLLAPLACAEQAGIVRRIGDPAAAFRFTHGLIRGALCHQNEKFESVNAPVGPTALV